MPSAAIARALSSTFIGIQGVHASDLCVQAVTWLCPRLHSTRASAYLLLRALMCGLHLQQKQTDAHRRALPIIFKQLYNVVAMDFKSWQ